MIRQKLKLAFLIFKIELVRRNVPDFYKDTHERTLGRIIVLTSVPCKHS